jgi:hypothetical protein
MIELLTSWFLKAFLSFAPKLTEGRMGTVQIRGKGRAFSADFFSNLRNFLLFSSPACRLLSTAYCFFPPPLFRGQSLSQSGHSLSKPDQPLSKPGLSLSLSGQSLSPQALFALSWSRITLTCSRIAPFFYKRLEA